MKLKNIIFLCLFLGTFLLTGCAEEEIVIKAEAECSEAETSVTTEAVESEVIYVYVCGRVEKPGVYQVPQDARICDAIALAGGVLEDANAEVLKQAEHMTDGETIYVPGKEESVNCSLSVDDGRVNINTATKDELMTLPGIGESKADVILQYREEHGNFQTIEELMEIQGIKEGVFNKIKDSIKTS